MACFEGTKAILTEAAMPIQLESDCANVVRELKANENSKSEISIIVSEVKHLLRDLPEVRISKVNIYANIAAHGLASFCRNLGVGGVLKGLVPPWVEG
jgi:hypothetical protein